MNKEEPRIGDSELDPLLSACINASFDCGEWTDESDEPYETVYERSVSAQTALVEAIRRRLNPA